MEILPPEDQMPRRPVFRERSYQAARAGIGLGTALAVAISWSVNKSILWAIVQGFFSWGYVIYFALTRTS